MIPKLRLREFYNAAGYTVYDFSDLFEFSSGKNIKQNEASKEFKTPCVRYGELYHMYSEVIDDVINRTNLESVELRFSLGDEILLPSAGEDPLGIGSASALTLPNIAIGRTINVLRPKQENTYSHIYVAYYINEKLKKKIASLAKGVSISNVYNSDLRTLQAVLPSVAEQNKVASFMRKIDTKINLLTKKKEALETYKKGLMQKIFSQELRFKREDGIDYPEWKKCSLGDVGDLNNGFAFKSDTYVEKGDYSIVTIKNVQNGKLINGFNYISELPKNIKKHHRLKMDDLLISMTGNVGRVCLVNQKNLLLNQRVGLIVLTDEMDKKLCFYQLQQNSMLNYFIANGEGAAQPNISKDVILNAHLRFPTDNEEKIKIISFFSRVDNLKDNVQDSMESAVKLKKGLLQQMFV